MPDPQNTVFISYRRKFSKAYARLLFDGLKERGFDVFFDYQSLPSGRWEEILFGEIGARAHFLVLLARGTLSDCKKEDDVLRKEIEHALRLKRNVVPIFIDGFDFRFKRYTKQLIGDLKKLTGYQGVELNNLADNFLRATLDTLQGYLNGAQPVQITPVLTDLQAEAQNAVKAVAGQLPPTREQLSAEDYFNRAYEKQDDGDLDGAIADYTEAIRLDPDDANAYYNRGNAWSDKRDLDRAIADYTKAIRLDPTLPDAYNNRGIAWRGQGDLDRAIADHTEAIRLDPAFAAAYTNRGSAWSDKGDLDRAIADDTEAIRLDPTFALAYSNRGSAWNEKGDLDRAIADDTEAIRLDPDDARAYTNRAIAWSDKGDLDRSIADGAESIRLDPTLANAYSNRGEGYFALSLYEQALSDFRAATKLDSKDNYALAGMAITLHALHKIDEAQSRWRALIDADPHYSDADWVGKELNWRPELIEQARKLIAEIDA